MTVSFRLECIFLHADLIVYVNIGVGRTYGERAHVASPFRGSRGTSDERASERSRPAFRRILPRSQRLSFAQLSFCRAVSTCCANAPHAALLLFEAGTRTGPAVGTFCSIALRVSGVVYRCVQELGRSFGCLPGRCPETFCSTEGHPLTRYGQGRRGLDFTHSG